VKASKILSKIDGIAYIQLDEADVVRHKLVKLILRAYDKDENEQEELKRQYRKVNDVIYPKGFDESNPPGVE
jgi:phosphate starvation-inducible PhoH-like protein